MDNLIDLAQERKKRVIEVTVDGEQVDFEALKEFLDTLEPDDYEMRVDALTLAIHQMSPYTAYYGVDTILSTAQEFYHFLKGG